MAQISAGGAPAPFLITPALAQPACGKRKEFLKELGPEYGEQVQARGLVGKGQAVVELFTNPKTGAWTMLITFPWGQTCVMQTGEAWQNVSPTNGGKEY